MSAIAEWQVPFTIQSSKGDLDLNDEASSDGLFLLIDAGCSATRGIRATVDEVPQGDGQINHARFTTGYEIELEVALWTDRENPACDADARVMAETLMLHLNSLLKDPGRLFWTPSGLGDQRLLDEAKLRECGPFTIGPAGDPRIRFKFDSPFPYVIDFTQDTIALPASTPVAVTNEGTVDFFPVVKVYGPTSAFVLANQTFGQSIVYNDALPGAVAIGGGDYVEIDFFRNTVYLNGSGANRKTGIDIELSVFWPLEAGVANSIEVTGASADLLLNHAYA